MKIMILFVALALVLTGCSKHDAYKVAKTAPAKVEKLPLETEIGRITLTPEAEQRLGIALAAITEQDTQRRRTFGAVVMIPTGKSIAVVAPFSGTISAPNDTSIPTPGQRLTLGGPVLWLTPILSPERSVPSPAEQVQMANARATLVAAIAVAQGDLQRGKAEVDAAKIALARAEKLFADRAGSARAVDEAHAQLNFSDSGFQAATEREKQLTKLIAELDKPVSERTALPLAMSAPQTGILRSLSVVPGQAITAGTLLFEITDADTVWIRVPIYVELLADIKADEAARIVSIGVAETAQEFLATPVAAPPSADALSSTVDLYFECKNNDGALRPGQRVGAQVTLRGQDRGLTAPAKAIVYDIYGGTWVYVRTAEHIFQRERVLVRFQQSDQVVLAESPAAGTQVVTDGVAELFGTEFGAGK